MNDMKEVKFATVAKLMQQSGRKASLAPSFFYHGF